MRIKAHPNLHLELTYKFLLCGRVRYTSKTFLIEGKVGHYVYLHASFGVAFRGLCGRRTTYKGVVDVSLMVTFL